MKKASKGYALEGVVLRSGASMSVSVVVAKDAVIRYAFSSTV
jgi:hypothetical protein